MDGTNVDGFMGAINFGASSGAIKCAKEITRFSTPRLRLNCASLELKNVPLLALRFLFLLST